ncbi:MAG: metal ABC transporter ATP-binding protein [Thermodesulfobacteriota bacterium]
MTEFSIGTGTEPETEQRIGARNEAPIEPLIELRNAAFGHDGGFQVRDVTLRIDPGDFVLLTGPNGSGKTTLIRGILGLLPGTAERVRWGIPRDRVGYVPQESAIHPDAPASALDVMRLGRASAWGVAKAAAAEALREVGLKAVARRRFGTLSGGEKRRVLLARALFAAPRLLILDEPVANVDAESKRRIETRLRALTAESGVGVLASSHSPGWVRDARRFRLRDGRPSPRQSGGIAPA